MEKVMNRSKVLLAAAVLTIAALNAGGQDAKAFRGEISDSQCAFNVHSLTRSHQEMLKSKSMGGTAAECSLYCIRRLGGNLVLSARQDVYHLDNQDLALKFIGHKVIVSGVLEAKTQTIHVVKIEPEP
jgi:hypothetical protein